MRPWVAIMSLASVKELTNSPQEYATREARAMRSHARGGGAASQTPGTGSITREREALTVPPNHATRGEDFR